MTDMIHADDYTVDVKLNSCGSTWEGRVLDTTARPVSQVPLLLVSEGKILDRTMTSPCGRFQARGLPQDSLELYVMIDAGNCLQLPLRAERQALPEQAAWVM